MRRLLIINIIFILISLITCKPSEKLTSPDHYILKKSLPERVKINEVAEFRVEIIPTDGYKMEEEAPIKLRFDRENQPHIEFEKELYTKEDLLNKNIKRPTFVGKFTPKTSGNIQFKGELSFVVCTPSICEPKKTEIIFNLLVE
ncbi:MAG: hypothetical protein N2746_03825 [Deltaproteobacteria bacterium]|nr:hypothetical protein [Deltaproteobacteria bacterium]